jgi:DNA-binding NtrC family response regulator
VFRSDLYPRLAGLVLRLPALRERSDETGALCDALVSELRDKLAKPDLEVTADGRDWIARQAWPGNIRELRNVLHRAAVLHGEPRLDASSLARFASPEPAMQSQGGSEGATELRSERERITDALERCGGNQTRAARMLGMTRRQLVYRIAGYGLPRPRGDGTKDDA